MKAFSVFDKILIFFALGLAAIFVMAIPHLPYQGDAFLKWLPVGLLAVLVLRHHRGPQETALVAAIIFHSIGDVMLVIDRVNLLVPATVGPYLLGHLCWAWAFWLSRSPRFTPKRLALAAGAVLYAVAVTPVILTSVSSLVGIGLAAYIICELIMALMAARSTLSTWVFVGAFSYMFSDTIIGLNQFVVDIPFDHPVASITYFIAQFGITLGVLTSRRQTRDENVEVHAEEALPSF